MRCETVVDAAGSTWWPVTPGAVSPAHHALLDRLRDRPRGAGDGPPAWHVVASPLVLDAERVDHDVRALIRLCRLIARLPQLAFDGDHHAYFRALGLPEHLDTLVHDDGLAADFYARPDCILSGGRLQAIEFNIGTGTVNLTAAFASKLNARMGRLCPDAVADLAPDWHFDEWRADEALAGALRELGGGRRVGLWYHDPTEAGRQRVEDMCELLDALGAAAVAVHTGDVQTIDLPLFGYHSSVHLLGPTGRALADALRGRPPGRTWLVRPGDLARTAKTNLALLHELAAAGRLGTADAHLVRRHIPPTHRVSRAPEDVRRHKDEWVLKPGLSFKAEGVLLGRDTSPSRWAQALRDRRDAVVQRLVEPDPVPLLLNGLNGQPPLVTDQGSLVLMPHLIGGRFAGLSARYGPQLTVLGRIDFTTVHSALCLTAARRGTGPASVPAPRRPDSTEETP